uniref:Protein N-terminal glutamine amidohydrolase n=1 Tax=Dendroctonus ponderosae TaxID=77166 RepID=A0AAR5PV01_DENPD
MATESNVRILQENQGILKKSVVNLFPKQGDCSYVSCYCEENVYKLGEEVTKAHPNELNKCYAVFISNQSRTVPLWRQRAGKNEDRLIIWDYHVIFLYHPEPDKCLVYDLDSELPFPTYVHKYFRVIPAGEFVNDFSSDRRHMKRPDGTWIKPPPNYPAITNSSADHNLEDYIQMDHNKGPGEVLNLTQFVQRFYKPAT